MRTALFVVAALAVGGACSKSKCEKYAEMEIKCGGIPSAEADMTRKLAEGMCEESEKSSNELSKMFQAEAACAAKHTDCAAYKACTDAAKPK